jgi:hypothetical protein
MPNISQSDIKITFITIFSFAAFQSGDNGLGWLFLLVGFVVAVLGFVLGGRDGSR